MRIVWITMVLASLGLALATYSRLPATMPVHWSVGGEVDRYAPKAIGAFVMPAIMIVVCVTFLALPAMSPRGSGIELHSRAYAAIVTAIMLFTLAVHVFMILAALRIAQSITTVMPILMGALFIVLGNYLPKFRRNFFIGIRTPWTLADEDVWYRTHRVGGVLFVLCGVLLMTIGPFLRAGATAFLVSSVMVAALVSIIYSFTIHRRSKNGPNPGGLSS